MKPSKVKVIFKSASIAALFLLTALYSCTPKEPIVFKGVKNITVDVGANGKPVLKGDVFFFNPNRTKMKLKGISIDVIVDGAKSAEVKQTMDLFIAGQSDFSVPLAAQLTLKESGFLDTVVGLLGGKKYDVVFTGYIRIGVHGITIKVPVSQKQELKLNL